ncbi:SGNH/GDSL hydrolase family protein [Paenibacillus sp. LjRoot153]|uniref:SGNH/GDSL hydrolase family protein n=1 Tax=Paenibacillus sp. LjRoot153 TaxID=3342270 RepID=UPI003ECEC077
MTTSRNVVLFQGDSITDGNRGRTTDPNHILGHGYAFIIGSKLGFDMAEETIEFVNCGVSGNRASDLYARWNEDCISIKPTLLSILIGVNDAWSSINEEPVGATDCFERTYRILLKETREVLPATKLVLCEPFILRTGATSERWDIWKKTMQGYQQTVRDLAEEFEAIFVPLQKAFEEACSRADASYWIWDGVHPTSAGHQLLANEWLSVVQQKGLI